MSKLLEELRKERDEAVSNRDTLKEYIDREDFIDTHSEVLVDGLREDYYLLDRRVAILYKMIDHLEDTNKEEESEELQ